MPWRIVPAPSGSFKTLMFSGKDEARMEQKTSDKHVVLKHGTDSNWLYDLSGLTHQPDLDTLSRLFIQGHEFHWLVLRPLDRFKDPVFEGITKFNGKNAFQLAFKDALNRSVYLYYDFENYLPLGMDNPTSDEENRVVVYFRDWTKNQEFQMMEKVEIHEGKVVWSYDFIDVRINYVHPDDFESARKFIFD